MSEGQKMSTDKLQATIAEILSEPPLTSTNTVPTSEAFLDEKEPKHPPAHASYKAINLEIRAEQTKSKKMSTDKIKATITEILSELRLDPPKTSPAPPAFFDEEHTKQTPVDASADAGNLAIPAEQAKSQKMSTDKLQATIAEILSEPPLTSTNTVPSPPAFFDEEPAPPTLSNQPNNVEPAVETAAVDPPTDAESAGRRAQQAKSLLAGLDLDTAIRLRWAMRDIRGKRTKMLPVYENDLAALVDLDFVEMREGLPRLKDLGILALD